MSPEPLTVTVEKRRARYAWWKMRCVLSCTVKEDKSGDGRWRVATMGPAGVDALHCHACPSQQHPTFANTIVEGSSNGKNDSDQCTASFTVATISERRHFHRNTMGPCSLVPTTVPCCLRHQPFITSIFEQLIGDTRRSRVEVGQVS